MPRAACWAPSQGGLGGSTATQTALANAVCGKAIWKRSLCLRAELTYSARLSG